MIRQRDRVGANRVPWPVADPERASPRRLLGAAGEVVAAVGAAMVMVALSGSVTVDPLDRVGQVSGLAGLDLRFVVVGTVVVIACAAASRGGAALRAGASRLSCAAVAGLATGLVAGGIVLALRGTDWPLFANSGDSGQLIKWADDVVAGRAAPADYPPVVIHVIALTSQLTGESTVGALRALQVLGTALFGPVAYLSWRLLLPPRWALAVALVAAFPLVEPYKPYTTVVLVVLVPVLIAFLEALRGVATLTSRRIAVVGIGTGAVLGALFCVYSGWFVWSAPGALVAVLVVFPARAAPRRGLALLGLAGAGFLVIAAGHLVGLVAAAGSVRDRYFYFDTFVEPAYIAMWRNDLPGNVGPWPPPGELAGVGVFVFLLVVGLGVAVALGGRGTAVATITALMAGSWLMRLHLASQMYADQSVQLYPRTTAEILHCLLLLSVLAVRLVTQRARERFGSGPVPPPGAGQGSGATLGVLCAALLLALSMGSSVADRYLPRNDGSAGLLAYVAQMVRQPDGSCPTYSSAPDRCAPDADILVHGPGGAPSRPAAERVPGE